MSLRLRALEHQAALCVNSNHLLELVRKVNNDSFQKSQEKRIKSANALDSKINRASIKRMIGERNSGKMFGERPRTDVIYPAQDWNRESHLYTQYAREQELMELKHC